MSSLCEFSLEDSLHGLVRSLSTTRVAALGAVPGCFGLPCCSFPFLSLSTGECKVRGYFQHPLRRSNQGTEGGGGARLPSVLR